MPHRGLYKPRPDDIPSNKMLDEVGLDFDNDLGGLQKGPPPPRSRLHPLWLWVALSIPILLIWVNPAYGWGFICGAASGLVAALVWHTTSARPDR